MSSTEKNTFTMMLQAKRAVSQLVFGLSFVFIVGVLVGCSSSSTESGQSSTVAEEVWRDDTSTDNWKDAYNTAKAEVSLRFHSVNGSLVFDPEPRKYWTKDDPGKSGEECHKILSIVHVPISKTATKPLQFVIVINDPGWHGNEVSVTSLTWPEGDPNSVLR